MIYGYDRTIHRTGHLNVELAPDGRVVAVWFRCLPLPYTVHRVDASRAQEMDAMAAGHQPRPIRAVHVDYVPEPDPGDRIARDDLYPEEQQVGRLRAAFRRLTHLVDLVRGGR
jgi:hypothetical protein